MWAAIGALIGLGTSANQGAQAQYAGQRVEYLNSLGFSQAKDMSFYRAYESSVKQIVIISVIGFLLIGFIVFMTLRKK